MKKQELINKMKKIDVAAKNKIFIMASKQIVKDIEMLNKKFSGYQFKLDYSSQNDIYINVLPKGNQPLLFNGGVTYEDIDEICMNETTVHTEQDNSMVKEILVALSELSSFIKYMNSEFGIYFVAT